MKNLLFFAFCLMISLTSCKKQKIVDDCVADFLEQNEMIPYNDQEIGCQFFVTLHEYKNKQYFVLGNHCADMMLTVVDCEGNDLCASTRKCNRFFEKNESLGIIGIRE